MKVRSSGWFRHPLGFRRTAVDVLLAMSPPLRIDQRPRIDVVDRSEGCGGERASPMTESVSFGEETHESGMWHNARRRRIQHCAALRRALRRVGGHLGGCLPIAPLVVMAIFGSCSSHVGRWITEEEWANLASATPTADRVLATLGEPTARERRDGGGVTLRYNYSRVRNRPGTQEFLVQLAWFSFDGQGELLDSGKKVLIFE